jgi:hypothetical protein
MDRLGQGLSANASYASRDAGSFPIKPPFTICENSRG